MHCTFFPVVGLKQLLWQLVLVFKKPGALLARATLLQNSGGVIPINPQYVLSDLLERNNYTSLCFEVKRSTAGALSELSRVDLNFGVLAIKSRSQHQELQVDSK